MRIRLIINVVYVLYISPRSLMLSSSLYIESTSRKNVFDLIRLCAEHQQHNRNSTSVHVFYVLYGWWTTPLCVIRSREYEIIESLEKWDVDRDIYEIA